MPSSNNTISNNGKNPFYEAFAPYAIPPVAAGTAIIPPYRDLMAKSALQLGKPVPQITIKEGIKQGIKAAPTVSFIVGTQMILENKIKQHLFKKDYQKTESFAYKIFLNFKTAGVVGIGSSPFLAVFNGQTMGWGIWESLKRFTPNQAVAISVQETAFVAGLSMADPVSEIAVEKFGNTPVVKYSSAFFSGFMGSFCGHPANTALTRWQNGMKVESISQSMWGSIRKARGVGFFAVGYKFLKDKMNA